MLRGTLVGLAIVLVPLAAVAAYYLYAPVPELDGPIDGATLDVGGHPRHYTVFTPSRLQAGASVLLVFHPSQSSGGHMRAFIGRVLERIAEKENVIVVYPDGYEGHFNDCRRVASYSARTLNVDDVGFAQHVVERLVAQKKANPARVYAIGYSNGGHMALRLALEAPTLVKGVAAVAANLPAPDNMDCKVAAQPTRRVAFVAGTNDPFNPYEGGRATIFGFGDRGNVLSAQASAEWFANRLGAVPPNGAIERHIADFAVRQQDWASADTHVRLLTIDGGGHTVPQAGYRFPRIFGATLQDDSLLESMWHFFAASGH